VFYYASKISPEVLIFRFGYLSSEQPVDIYVSMDVRIHVYFLKPKSVCEQRKKGKRKHCDSPEQPDVSILYDDSPTFSTAVNNTSYGIPHPVTAFSIGKKYF
jgi:hypothetical protein